MGQEQVKLSGQVGLYWKETLEMNGLFDRFVLNVVVHLVDKPSGGEIMLKGVPSGGTRVEEL